MVNVVLFCSLQCCIHGSIQKNNKISPPISQLILFFFKLKFICSFFGCVGSWLLCGLSLLAASGGCSLVWCVVTSVVEHRLWSVWAPAIVLQGLIALQRDLR